MNDPRTQMMRSHAAIARGELTAARTLLAQLAGEPSVHIDALHALAVVERRLRNFAAADRLFGEVLRERPGDAVAHNNYANLLRDTGDLASAARHYRQALVFKPDYVDAMINLGLVLRTLAEPAQSCEILQRAATLAPGNARAWHGLGLALRDLERMDDAADALDEALRLAPGNAQALHARARLEADRGRPALAFYAQAGRAAPEDVDVAIGLAVSRFEAGDARTAIDELQALVNRRPQAVKAHVCLAQLRWQLGTDDFAHSFDAALERMPAAVELQIGQFGTLMRAGRYAAVLDRLPRARERIAAPELFDRYEAVCASESGDVERAERVFERLHACGDRDLQVAHLRHLLRTQRPAQAARLAETLVQEPGTMQAWPYLHVAWRLIEDPRWQWLERAQDCVAHFDFPDLLPSLPALAQLLRGIHHTRVHPFDQSLRHGTQSDGHLFARSEPQLAELRRCIERGVAAFIARLPPPDRSHPFLRQPRSQYRFAGAYSVRLRAPGFHINHMHPDAWISCCLYVDMPDCIGADERDPAGWLVLGQPPRELGLDLPPTAMLRPRPGRLVVFPSFLWHGSVPFARGERLTVVSDLASVS